MSCGCCILCSSDEPMPEFGQASVEYFNSSNSEELSKKISEMISDDMRHSELKKLALQTSTKFSWDKFTSDVVKLYDGVVI